MQWRLRFPGYIWFNEESLIDIATICLQKFRSSLTIGCAPTLITQFNSEFPTDFAENYGLNTDRYDKVIESHLTNVVSSFTQIGIEDPFPTEVYEFEDEIPEKCYEPSI